MSPRRAAALRDSQDDAGLREHLLVTAERLIARAGTVGLTVRAVAAEAGVADGVLYNYFANKEELLAQALLAHVRSVESGLGPLPEPGRGPLEANLGTHVRYGLALHRGILPAFTGLVSQPRVLARFAALDQPGQLWRDQLVDYLRAERDLGRLAPDAPVEAAAAMIVGVCHEAVLSLLLHGAASRSGPPAPDVDALVRVVLRGIAEDGH